jgi:predicted dehydrogenase
MKKVRWGILSTANIAVKKVIPAMQRGLYTEVVAIASRDLEKARSTAKALRIPRAYGSYEELLADPEIEAVYNPLPNHLHVPWSIRALKAGKHVLCEKPIAMTTTEARLLAAAAEKHRHLKVMEAFMYRNHPQWLLAVRLVRNGKIGTLKTIQSFFSYHNTDLGNVRNIPEFGGGGLMDIGCYCISLSRLLFNAEPKRVFGLLEIDPVFKVDRMASGILDFGGGVSTFTCGTQLSFYQRVNIIGEEGRIEIEIPFNAPPNRSTRLRVQLEARPLEEIVVEPCDQYTIQGDLFSRAVLNDTPVPISLQDSIGNMQVIDAVIKSSKAGRWVQYP